MTPRWWRRRASGSADAISPQGATARGEAGGDVGGFCVRVDWPGTDGGHSLERRCADFEDASRSVETLRRRWRAGGAGARLSFRVVAVTEEQWRQHRTTRLCCDPSCR